MTLFRALSYLAIVLAVVQLASPATGQTTTQETKTLETVGGTDDQPIMQKWVIHHSDPKVVNEILQTMLDGRDVRMVIDSTSNSLIVRGSRSDLDMIAELFKKIDVPQPSKPAPEIRVFMLASDANSLKDVITAHIPKSSEFNTRIAVDHRLNGLVISSESTETLDMIGTLIDRLDSVPAKAKPPAKLVNNCQVKVSWLIDREDKIAKPEKDSIGSPGASLRDLVGQLKEDKVLADPGLFSEISTMVSLSNSVVDGRDFSNSTERYLGNSPRYLAVEGDVVMQENGNFKLSVELMFSGSQSANAGHPNSNVSTVLEIPKNHPVAFSVSDVNSLKSVIVLEVVEIE